MKIEVSLDGIFADEEGNEVEASVRDEIVDQVVSRITRVIQTQVEKLTSAAIEAGIKDAVTAKMNELMPSFLDHEYQEVNSWGEKKETYTVRSRIIKHIEEHCVYSPKSDRYYENAFTKAIRDTLSEKLRQFQNEFNKNVDADFIKEARAYAEKRMAERLGVKA